MQWLSVVNAIYLDFLSNLDDAAIFRELLEFIGDDAMSIVIAGFQMKKRNDEKSLKNLKDRLHELNKEVNSWLLQEVQN